MRVLIVDDDPVSNYILVLHLKKNGPRGIHYSIETCPLATLERLKRYDPFDIIFLDLVMPKMTGTELMEAARKLGYTCPIILVTARKMDAPKGFDAALQKPIISEEIKGLLNG